MKTKKLYILLSFIIAASLSCFRPNFISIPDTTYKFVTYFLTLLFICVTYRNNRVNDKFFTYSIVLLSLCQLLSAYNAFAFEGQSLGVSILATMQGFAYILFIPLSKSRINSDDIEKIVKVFAVGFLLCSLINRFSPITLFGSADEGSDRGATRFRIVGIYWAMFYLLMKVNHYALRRQRQNLYWIIAMGMAILSSLTRQDIVVSFLMAGLLFFQNVKPIKKIIFVGCLIFLVTVVLPRFTIYNSLVEKTMEEKDAQEHANYDNIRIVAADYFLFEYPRNTQQVLFGVGVPSFGNSTYGDQFLRTQEFLKVFREDVGYCGFYYNYGLIATVLIILMFGRVLFLKLPDRYIYLKYYSGAFLLLNIASAPCLPNLSIIPFVISLYLANLVKLSNRKSKQVKRISYV